MKTSAAGRAFIEHWEENGKPLLVARWDALGKCWEIGFGHTSAAGLPHVYPGMIITSSEADNILSSDLSAVEADIAHHVHTIINQNQYDAIVSFDFNTGGLNRSSVLIDITRGDFDAVPKHLLSWCHSGGHFVQGLYDRRKAEGVLWCKPMGEK